MRCYWIFLSLAQAKYDRDKSGQESDKVFWGSFQHMTTKLNNFSEDYIDVEFRTYLEDQ